MTIRRRTFTLIMESRKLWWISVMARFTEAACLRERGGWSVNGLPFIKPNFRKTGIGQRLSCRFYPLNLCETMIL